MLAAYRWLDLVARHNYGSYSLVHLHFNVPIWSCYTAVPDFDTLDNINVTNIGR